MSPRKKKPFFITVYLELHDLLPTHDRLLFLSPLLTLLLFLKHTNKTSTSKSQCFVPSAYSPCPMISTLLLYPFLCTWSFNDQFSSFPHILSRVSVSADLFLSHDSVWLRVGGYLFWCFSMLLLSQVFILLFSSALKESIHFLYILFCLHNNDIIFFKWIKYSFVYK